MTRRTAPPTPQAVRTAITELTAMLGKPPSALAVAQKLGIPNTTFRRAFPEIAAELQLTRTSRPSQDPADINRFDQLKLDNAKLRADNRELSAHLDLAAANIQRLTLANHHLAQQLKAEAQITHLPARRAVDQSGTRDHGGPEIHPDRPRARNI